MKQRRLAKAIKKRARAVQARLVGRPAKHLSKITWREQQAIAGTQWREMDEPSSAAVRDDPGVSKREVS
jgi:hypothetical protein